MCSSDPVSAPEGARAIEEVIRKYGESITILAGGGIRSSNINLLKQIKGLSEVHSAAISGAGETADEAEVKKLMAAL